MNDTKYKVKDLTSEPESEECKKNACKYLTALAFMALSVGYYKQGWKWSPLKTRQIAYMKGVHGAGGAH
jgi:hypothetical protein